jgi:selenium metabolism protein YedF
MLTKKALDAGGLGALEVLVDNETARENVLRYAAWAGYGATSSPEGEGCHLIRIALAATEGSAASAAALPPTRAPSSVAPAPGLDPASCAEEGPSLASAAGATLLVASEHLGRGENELGALLMKGFIYAISESESPPRRIVCINSGVKLAIEGSESLANLQKLAGRGVEILACGTCLDYFHLKERLRVGRVSNMYEISSFLLEGRTISL